MTESHFTVPVPVKPYVKAYMERQLLPPARTLSSFSPSHVCCLIYSVLDNRAQPYFPKKQDVVVIFYLSQEAARRRKASCLGTRGRKMAEGLMVDQFKKATYDHVLATMMDGSNKNEGLHTFREKYGIHEDMYSLRSHLQALDRYADPLPMLLNSSIRKERLDRMYWEVRYHTAMDPEKRSTRHHIRDFYTKNKDQKELMTEERAWHFIKQFRWIRARPEAKATSRKTGGACSTT
jgi:hypothetical protein